jgi:hypothetical protein
MAHIPLNPAEDYFVVNDSGFSDEGRMVSRYVLHGPGLPSGGLDFQTKEDADAKGRKLAREAGASLWYRPDPKEPRVTMTESFRESQS